jgi:hypothetical protein
MALKTRSRSQSIGEDDSPEDILAEKYRNADGVREVDPSEITSATRVNRIAAGAQAAQFPEERHRCFAVIGAHIRDRSAREQRLGLQKCSRRRREAWWTRRARDTWESEASGGVLAIDGVWKRVGASPRRRNACAELFDRDQINVED